MANNFTDTHYIGEIDQLLQKFRQEKPILSLSQDKEHKQYLRIASLRDQPITMDTATSIWDKF